jgi:hypothetical protein
MADAITRGILNPAKWSIVPPTAPYRIAIDPLGGAAFPVSMMPIVLDNLDPISAPQAVEVAFRGEDDVAYGQPDDGDVPATPVYLPAVPPAPGVRRVTTGSFSWLATLLPAGSPTAGAYRLSVVVLHDRQVPPPFPGPFAVPPITGPFTPSSEVRVTALGMTSLDDFRQTFERGSPILIAPSPPASDVPVWRTIVLPLPQRGSGGIVNDAELLLDSPVPFAAGQIFAFPGAVGIAEKTVRLEGQSPWAL